MTTEQFEAWLHRAESNLRIAHLGRREGVFLEDLCFEAQQAAEKALKALLIYLSGDYPRVHAFALILELLEQHVVVPEPIREVVELTDYAVQIRYDDATENWEGKAPLIPLIREVLDKERERRRIWSRRSSAIPALPFASSSRTTPCWSQRRWPGSTSLRPIGSAMRSEWRWPLCGLTRA